MAPERLRPLGVSHSAGRRCRGPAGAAPRGSDLWAEQSQCQLKRVVRLRKTQQLCHDVSARGGEQVMENPRLSKIQVSQAGHRSRAVVRELEAEGTCSAPGRAGPTPSAALRALRTGVERSPRQTGHEVRTRRVPVPAEP